MNDEYSTYPTFCGLVTRSTLSKSDKFEACMPDDRKNHHLCTRKYQDHHSSHTCIAEFLVSQASELPRLRESVGNPVSFECGGVEGRFTDFRWEVLHMVIDNRNSLQKRFRDMKEGL